MIYIFTAVILFAFICLMVICIKIMEENSALKAHLSIINKDYENLLNENISLIEKLSKK